MVHDTSVLIEGSILNIFFSANMFQIIQFVKDEFMRMNEKIKENLNLLREKGIHMFNMVTLTSVKPKTSPNGTALWLAI